MGHIRKTESGKYEAFVELGKDPGTGKRKQKTKTFVKKREAKNWMAKKRQERNKGMFINPSDMTVESFFLQWLKDYCKPNLSPTTYDGYKMIIKTHIIPSIGALKLKNLKPMHIQSYESQKLRKGRKDGKPGGLSKKTVLQHHRILNKALKQAVLWQLISYNPVKSVPAPKPTKKEIKSMTKKEVNKLLKKAEGKWIYYLIYLAVNTGMRRGELLGLRWSDVNFNDQSIYISQTLVKANNTAIFKSPKTKNSKRRIEFSDVDKSILKNLKKEQAKKSLAFGNDYNKESLVFCDKDGSITRPDRASKRFVKIAEKAGLSEFRFHDLRHTHATLMLQAGVHPKVVQERLGHSTITTTLDTYSHVTPSMQKESVEKYKEYFNQ